MDLIHLGIALASGVAIGGFFVCLGRTATPAGLWPLAISRTVFNLGEALLALGKSAEAAP